MKILNCITTLRNKRDPYNQLSDGMRKQLVDSKGVMTLKIEYDKTKVESNRRSKEYNA